MAKRWKLSTEKSLLLQEEIEAYLRWKSSLESRESGELPFEQRLDKALRGEDPELFEDIAALFRGRRINRHPSSEGYEKGVEQVAVLARKWLESLQQPVVTAENVKEIAKTIWAARAVGYKPNENLVFTQTQQGSIELWTPKDDAYFALEKKRVNLSLVVQRSPGKLSELDYVSALHTNWQFRKTPNFVPISPSLCVRFLKPRGTVFGKVLNFQTSNARAGARRRSISRAN
jgi:hypothetical protein